MIQEDDKTHISSKYCGNCGREGDGFKCPRCSKTENYYDPLHWKKCKEAGKLQVRCKQCGQSESICSC